MCSKSSAYSCRTRALIRENPWIKAVADPNRNFELHPHPASRSLWGIWLAPWFELSVRPESVGELGAAAGIYRNRDAGRAVIYIGKGRIVDGCRDPERREHGIARIEYSLVPENGQYEWKEFHLDDFAKEQGGRRTRFNKVASRL